MMHILQKYIHSNSRTTLKGYSASIRNHFVVVSGSVFCVHPAPTTQTPGILSPRPWPCACLAMGIDLAEILH